jgi:hypothetical protein
MKINGFFLSLILFFGCTTNRVIISFQQNSELFKVKVDDVKMVSIKDKEYTTPRLGWLDISPIVNYESSNVKEIVLILYKGVYFLTAENFRNIWLIKCKKDGLTASCTPISLPSNKIIGKSPLLSISDDKKWVIIYYDSGNGIKPKFKINCKGRIEEVK